MIKPSSASLAVLLATLPSVVTSDVFAYEEAQHQIQNEINIVLTIDEAVRLALTSDDPYLRQPEEMASSYEQAGIADSQLADPKVRLNFANWPLDSFSYSQEPMTQIQVGVSQSFPKGNTLKFRREKRNAQAKGERHKQALREREVVLDTRMIWLELSYLSGAKSKIQESRTAVKELLTVIQSVFSSGRQTSQDILRAELEISILDDRLVNIERQTAMLRAKLARRIGNKAFSAQIPSSPPGLRHPSNPTAVLETLISHPAAKLRSAMIEAADKDVSIAGESYKPGWTINAGYGARGGDRTDFASVGVTMDLPLFTEKRQDKRVQAAKKARQANRFSKDTVLLELRKQLQVARADWEQLDERIKLYQSVVLVRAKDTREASLNSYQSGVTDFPELVRSRLAELDTELKIIRLKADRFKAQAQLLFLEGENDA